MVSMVAFPLSSAVNQGQILLILAWRLLLIIGASQAVQASAVPFQDGDVLVGLQDGTVRHYSPQGTVRGTLPTGASSEIDGMAFDAEGNLFVTGFEAQKVFKFDHEGNLLGPFGSGYDAKPESIVFDSNGNAYVGQAEGSHQILKFSSSGAAIGSFSPQTESRGSDWIDLASDQCTIFYTSEGSSIKRFNVCANTQLLPDFATGLNGRCYALRIRPNSEVLVACSKLVYRLDSSGNIMQKYILTGAQELFALNLDPDNKSFWTGDAETGTISRVEIASGNTLVTFKAGDGVGGVAVVGEITAAQIATGWKTIAGLAAGVLVLAGGGVIYRGRKLFRKWIRVTPNLEGGTQKLSIGSGEGRSQSVGIRCVQAAGECTVELVGKERKNI